MEVSESIRSLLRKLSEIKKLLRVVEIFSTLVFITWIFSRIPLLVRVSTECFFKLASVVLSPLFVFFVSNAIGLSLFFFFNSQRDYSSEAHIECYSEIIHDNEGYYYHRNKLLEDDEEVSTTGVVVDGCSDAAVYEDKQTIVEVMKKEKTTSLTFEDDVKGSTAEDRMSDEEFQRAIDAFIAKQVKFHKEEKKSAVVVVPLGNM